MIADLAMRGHGGEGWRFAPRLGLLLGAVEIGRTVGRVRRLAGKHIVGDAGRRLVSLGVRVDLDRAFAIGWRPGFELVPPLDDCADVAIVAELAGLGCQAIADDVRDRRLPLGGLVASLAEDGLGKHIAVGGEKVGHARSP